MKNLRFFNLIRQLIQKQKYKSLIYVKNYLNEENCKITCFKIGSRISTIIIVKLLKR